MTTKELIAIYQRVWSEKTAIFGQPDGALTPQEAAGALLVQHKALFYARCIARDKKQQRPEPWGFEASVADVLEHAVEA